LLSGRYVFHVSSLGHSGLGKLADDATRAFHEGKLVCETAFEQDTNSVVPRQVGCRSQGCVLSNLEMYKVYQLCQDEQALGSGGLDFIQFLSEILKKDFLKASTELRGFLSDELEALIKFG